jgi:hypothetical protein
VPYKTILFKASKLEEAIKEYIREYSIFVDKGNNGKEPEKGAISPLTRGIPRYYTSNTSIASFSIRSLTSY